jgi:hypothetical protein
MKITLEEFRKARRAQRVELESHDVELGLLDDIKKLQITANNSSDKAISELKKVFSILDNSNTFFLNTIKDSRVVIENIDKARLMAKDLGIELPNNIDALSKFYDNQIKDSELYIKDINQFKSKLS